jgi:DNA-binding XRE family transcriptional regulator
VSPSTDQCHILVHGYLLINTKMAASNSSDPEKLSEIGKLLQQARERSERTIEDMAKKMGLRAEQIQAIEMGNPEPFKKNVQPMIWYARLYAKKLGIELPELVFMDIKRADGHPYAPIPPIPAFLIKAKSKEND